MSATVTESTPTPAGMSRLVMQGYEGITHKLISNKPPRNCTPEEIPIIDLARMSGDLSARKELAAEILHASETIGFFYIKNHGILEDTIANSVSKVKEFFALPPDQKEKAATTASAYGYRALRQTHINPSNTKDRKETFMFHYKPEFDPLYEGRLSEVPQKVIDHIPKDDDIWDPVGISDYQETLLVHYQAYLSLARGLIRIIALSLNLPEDYFDGYTTYPGGDYVVNYYPGHGDQIVEDSEEVGIGAHTDFQILTLLWQDENRGLQVLNNDNEWVYAPPIPGTIVVNLGDFLMRLTNDRLKSTVHRVIQHGKQDRISLPFFFGFNFDEKLGVLPTCVDDDHPAKYEPATCGELIKKRLARGSYDSGKASAY